MVNNLVVNGCSYMESYASGGGHTHLALQLGIPNCQSLAIGGSANSRILRTTLKHSYTVTEPTLYVLGMTFVSRNEIPILSYGKNENCDTSFEGRWANPQNQILKDRWEHFWSEKDSRDWVNTQHKVEVYSLLDRTEDLMYRMLSAISDLTKRGHQVVMFQQADDSYMLLDNNVPMIDSPRLSLFSETKNIVEGFKWQSIQWQHNQGVPTMQYIVNRPGHVQATAILSPGAPEGGTPLHIMHRQPGRHIELNQYLTDYIKNELHL